MPDEICDLLFAADDAPAVFTRAVSRERCTVADYWAGSLLPTVPVCSICRLSGTPSIRQPRLSIWCSDNSQQVYLQLYSNMYAVM